ncbi:sulfate ABC transporter substrate-binding protein [Paenibacillus sp. FSL H7-0357]|uniref:Sulfate ABC transporter substrate-binding protein n=1 Tax=Paenibacillus borealis TaxID=160799 RepID=A0ABX3HBW2_PAEBO|nr:MULTISPECIES: sulfate ABC transporter substrate-binding protein [Paenibacillus]AIQ16420.1 sulfate ABC transporter substrate-binding protein [Paenibacillus sp. FSL H7-0357]OMD47015.1 sulfate ABC transporter substrate-binding protein [Paenibacillus borealis]
MRLFKRSRQLHGWLAALMLVLLALALAGCAKEQDTAAEETPQQGDLTLVVGAYSVAKDAMGDILPLFAAKWKAETGQTITFQESYEASGTQARAIAGGFEADVTLLAMEGDVDKLVKAGLVEKTWKERGEAGMVTRSVVALGTREGNPKGIHDFADLAKPGVKVLYPNPKTSGGAQWDINAIYGAGLKLSEAQEGVKDPAAAKAFLESIHANVESLDKSGRASMAAFEYGVGDVIVTYENELLARIAQGVNYEVIIPQNTILIENPAAVVDKYADEHGTREAAEALVDFLTTREAQEVFAEYGFRPVNEQVYAENADHYPVPAGLFDIQYLGGWDEVRSTLYAKRGVWYQVLAGI